MKNLIVIKVFMLYILILLLVTVAQSKIIELNDTELYSTDGGGNYFEDQQFIYKVSDENGFKMEYGRAAIKFEVANEGMANDAKILDFKKLPDLHSRSRFSNFKQSYRIPNIFDRSFQVAIIRHDVTEGTCLSIEAAKNHIHYYNLQMRLLTGYRSEYDEEKSYITPQCYLLSDVCFKDPGSLATCGWSRSKVEDPSLRDRMFSNRVHFFKGPFGWSGMGVVASDDYFVIPFNRWSLVHLTKDTSIWTGLSTAFHEIGHNLGYNHANKSPTETRFLRQYVRRDGYGDSSNYMGLGSYFYNIPGAAQFMRVSNKNSLYLPWMKQCESGIHTYRLYAWDYAYTRVFLGDDKRITHQDEDLVDGLLFKYHTAAIMIEYGNNTFNTALSPLKHGSISIEYHWFPNGLESYKNRGVKVLISNFDNGTANIGIYSMYLFAEVDDQEDISASEIPLQYVKVPEVDIGTMKFRILKFHTIEDIYPNPELLEKFPNQTITAEDLPYLDIEITHLPNVPYTPPTTMAPVPELIFSSSLSNCNYNSATNTYRCEYFHENNYWTYVMPGPSTNNTLPRFYSYKGDALITIPNGRLGVVSYPGNSVGKHAIISGTMDIEKVRRTNIDIVKNGVAVIVSTLNQDCTVYSYNFATNKKELYQHPDLISDQYDALFVKNSIKTYSSFYLTYMYNNNIPIVMTNISSENGGMIFFKPLELQGFSKFFLKMLGTNGKVANQITITRQQKKSSNRVALFNFDPEKGTITVEPATLKGKKTTPYMAGPIELVQNIWHFFPYNNFQILESIYIDFEREIPEGLFVEIMTEMGVFRKDVSYMAMFPGQTAKITILEISQTTGGWGEVYQFKFNKNVKLLGMRHVLLSDNTITQPGLSPPIIDRYYTLVANKEKYYLDCNLIMPDYEFQPFKITLLNQDLSFNSELNQFKINIAGPHSVKYELKQIYNVLTEEVQLVPTIIPNIGKYSYTMNTEIEGLSINELTGVITGYINNNLHKNIEIIVKGSRTINYTFDLNIECKIIISL